MTTEQFDIIRKAVKSRMSFILDLTDRTKRLNQDIDNGDTHPFCLALFGREKMFNAKLITSLQTTLGMAFYEQISKTMGEIAGYEVTNQYKLKGYIDKEAKAYLDNLLEDIKYQPNRHNEQMALVEIFKKKYPSSSTINSKNFIEIPDSTVDVFIKKPDGTEIFIDITTVKSNKKSFRILKEKILKWFYLRLSQGDIEPEKIKTYFAIPYNPEDPESDVYNRFSTYYDREDLLVGNQLWKLVSGDQFTQKDLQNVFLEIANEQVSIEDKELNQSINYKILENIYTPEQLEQFTELRAMHYSQWNDELKIKPKRDYTLVEFFAGAGGLALGLEQAGFKHLMLNEIDKHDCNTLRFNRPHWNVIENDISKVDFSQWQDKVDIVVGGIPSQSFSLSGKSLESENIKGTLVFEMVRAIKEIQPKIFLVENTAALLLHDKACTLKIIIKTMEDLGYTIIEKDIYKALFYKVPQKRERLIIIGVRSDLVNDIKFEKPSPYHRVMTLKDAFFSGELYDCDVPESMGQKYPERKAEIMSYVPEGGYWRDLSIELQKEYMQGSFHLGGGKTGMARRLSWSEPSLTLTCSPAQKLTERCHPSENRPLTTREYARIQTFPDDWEFQGSMTQIYKQIGNAVPVNLAAALGRALVSYLNKIEK